MRYFAAYDAFVFERAPGDGARAAGRTLPTWPSFAWAQGAQGSPTGMQASCLGWSDRCFFPGDQQQAARAAT